MFLASALKQTDDPAILPKHLCFDRGPTSIWEVSKKYFFGFGMLLYPLVKFSGWASDVEQNILDFHQKSKNPPSITIVGADEDHHFSGAANLSCGEKIKTIPNIQILVFAPPHQMVNETGQHNMRADFLNSKYLTEPSNFMTPSENLSQAILRRSIPST